MWYNRASHFQATAEANNLAAVSMSRTLYSHEMEEVGLIKPKIKCCDNSKTNTQARKIQKEKYLRLSPLCIFTQRKNVAVKNPKQQKYGW